MLTLYKNRLVEEDFDELDEEDEEDDDPNAEYDVSSTISVSYHNLNSSARQIEDSDSEKPDPKKRRHD